MPIPEQAPQPSPDHHPDDHVVWSGASGKETFDDLVVVPGEVVEAEIVPPDEGPQVEEPRDSREVQDELNAQIDAEATRRTILGQLKDASEKGLSPIDAEALENFTNRNAERLDEGTLASVEVMIAAGREKYDELHADKTSASSREAASSDDEEEPAPEAPSETILNALEGARESGLSPQEAEALRKFAAANSGAFPKGTQDLIERNIRIAEERFVVSASYPNSEPKSAASGGTAKKADSSEKPSKPASSGPTEPTSPSVARPASDASKDAAHAAARRHVKAATAGDDTTAASVPPKPPKPDAPDSPRGPSADDAEARRSGAGRRRASEPGEGETSEADAAEFLRKHYGADEATAGGGGGTPPEADPTPSSPEDEPESLSNEALIDLYKKVLGEAEWSYTRAGARSGLEKEGIVINGKGSYIPGQRDDKGKPLFKGPVETDALIMQWAHERNDGNGRELITTPDADAIFEAYKTLAENVQFAGRDPETGTALYTDAAKNPLNTALVEELRRVADVPALLGHLGSSAEGTWRKTIAKAFLEPGHPHEIPLMEGNITFKRPVPKKQEEAKTETRLPLSESTERLLADADIESPASMEAVLKYFHETPEMYLSRKDRNAFREGLAALEAYKERANKAEGEDKEGFAYRRIDSDDWLKRVQHPWEVTHSSIATESTKPEAILAAAQEKAQLDKALSERLKQLNWQEAVKAATEDRATATEQIALQKEVARLYDEQVDEVRKSVRKAAEDDALAARRDEIQRLRDGMAGATASDRARYEAWIHELEDTRDANAQAAGEKAGEDSAVQTRSALNQRPVMAELRRRAQETHGR